MFEIIFGSMLLAFPILSIVFTLLTGVESDNIGMFVIISVVFFTAGIVYLTKGLKKIHKNILTNKHGTVGYGVIADIIGTNNWINGAQVYNIKIVVLDGNEKKEFIEDIGLYPERYLIGTFVQVKYFNDDANVIKKIKETTVSQELKDLKEEIMNSFADEIQYY